jgi:uroporphyrinogen-III synthase
MSEAGESHPAARCDDIPPLLGHVVGVTGDRRVEELTRHLEARGAAVLHGPMLHTKPITDDDRHLRAVTAALIARPPQYLLATTAIGVRSWVNAAATWGVRSELLAALASTKVLARGPKVVGAVHEAGLPVWFAEPSGRTRSMIDRLTREDVEGAHVALQLPGGDMTDAVRRLRAARVDLTSIAVYESTWPDDLTAPRRLLRAIVEQRVSAITFTSRPAVRNFVDLARREGILAEVEQVFHRDAVVAVCVGAVTADELRATTTIEPSEPAQSLLGMLVQLTSDEVRRREHQHLRTADGHEIVVQRRSVTGGGVSVMTSDREAALLRRLLATPRRTVSRDALLRDVWRGEQVDPSVLETTMARLRRRLAKTNLSVLTISGRGYLLNGEVVPCAQPPGDDPLGRLASVS